MSTDPEALSEHDQSAEHLERLEQLLAREDEELKRVDEEIREAIRKSKSVIPDPEP